MRLTKPTRGRPLLTSCAGALSLLLLAACGDGPADPPGEEDFTIAYIHALDIDFDAMDVWVMTEDGRARRQVTMLPTETRSPAWSPDGERIAFINYPDPNSSVPALMVVNADGSGLRTVHSGLPLVQEPMWSPQSDRLAVHYTGSGGTTYVALIGADGSGLAPVAGTEGANTYRPAWSPSGDRLLFTRGTTLQVIGTAGGAPQQIAINAAGGRYSPDGTRIAALSSDGIVVMNADGTGRTAVVPRFFAGGTVHGHVAWSRDGRRLVFYGPDGNGQNLDLFTVPVTGGTPTNVSRTRGQLEVEPDWR